ncbi:MAG: TIGR04283 family arsenosugar biosynthesis glycosyltransferase [Panacagrimonas sp.]
MSRSAPSLSIIVPMLDEAATLPGLLAHLEPFRARGCEIIFVDGGSQDESLAIARRAGGCVLEAARGRARQMNAGARVAQGGALLFLHADTRLPDAADGAVLRALATTGRAWGRFDVRITGRSPWLRVIGGMMNLRSRLTGIATGDQAIFVTRAVFDSFGGFPELPLMEDIEMSRRLKRMSPPACLTARVSTSGRRWESRGIWRTILLMWRLRLAYWRGTPASQLAGRYR